MVKCCYLWLLVVAFCSKQTNVAGQFVIIAQPQVDEWWEGIKTDYDGTLPLRRACNQGKLAQGSQCSRPHACFMGTKQCPQMGPYPLHQCSCSDDGMWSCEDASCPAAVAQEVTTSRLVYRSGPRQAFDVEMNLLTSDVLSGYATVEELVYDLNQTVRFYVNTIIQEQTRNPFPIFAVAELADSPAASPSAEGANDFETNNQEEGVDEADTVKSDGTNVYVAYGDVLVIWDAITGASITNYTLPAPSQEFNEYYYYWNRPNILGMSLEDDRLVLYVSGYGNDARNSNPTASIFYNSFETRIVVLDISNLPLLTVVAHKDIHGYYRDARAVGSDVHVVTTFGIDYYSGFGPIHRWNIEYEGMNDTEYKEAATIAAGPLIDDFVARLQKDVPLIFDGNDVSNIPKISIWQTELGENDNMVETIYSGGAIQSFSRITSFSTASASAVGLSESTAGAFMPSNWGHTYVVDGNLMLAGQGYNWMPDFRSSAQTTYLMGFSLSGASAKPSFVQSVPGYINNQYSLNIYNGTMSIATTIRMWWPVWEPVEDENDDIIGWPWSVFNTSNAVYVYNLPSATEPITEAGRVENLGKEGEVFTSVRFFGNICYAVTFRQTDPFYVISTDPTDIRLLGELEISGFSSYIHSINADDTLLVAVGQETDDNGRVLGVQISLFDATSPSNPTLLHRSVVEQETDVWSSSQVSWDYKAFRYLTLGPDFGIVIIPLRVVAWRQDDLDGNFDGFLAYDVSREYGISQRFNVSHVESDRFYSCYYPAYLPERSVVINGNVTTMKGHSVINTDLDTFESRWTLEMGKPTEKSHCVPWLF